MEEKKIVEKNSMEEMMEMYMDGFKNPRRGSVVSGTVVQVSESEVVVNIGYKADGIIPKGEISNSSDLDIREQFKEGQPIDVFIVKKDDGDGNVLLSLKRVSMIKDWDALEKLDGEDAEIEVSVKEAVKGGVIAYYAEARGFIPASQLSDGFVRDVTPYLNKVLKVKIIEFNKAKKRAVFSHKQFAAQISKAEKAAFWSKIEIGQVRVGEVKRISNFGAFVDIGGFDGLVHVTEMTWGRMKSPKEFVKVGEKIDVKIIDANFDDEKISLSIRQVSEEPWSKFEEKYNVGDIYSGKIVNLTDFGAFVELEPGIEGLVHVSQIANFRVEKPSDVLKLNEIVDVRILDVDLDNRKVKLSMKTEEVEAPVQEENNEA